MMAAMTSVIAHPFRLAAGGAVAVVDDRSDAGLAQEIAVLVATRKGERPLVPGYGLTDPVFDQVDVAQINAALTAYGPDGLTVDGIDVTVVDGSRQRVTLTYAVV